MTVNKLKWNPDKIEVLLVGSFLVLRNGCSLKLSGTALTTKPSFHRLGVPSGSKTVLS